MKILFVCLGNICRSPAAEAVLRKKLRDKGLEGRIEVDSAGTIGAHQGDPPDSRMQRAARSRGIAMGGTARQVKADDLAAFDLILAMDRSNLTDLRRLWDGSSSGEKVRLFGEFCGGAGDTEVPDPYYGGPEGFEDVLDLLEVGCEELLRRWKVRELPGSW